nr:MAG TPA: endosialidase chaperone [Caudoviricetes sp.]
MSGTMLAADLNFPTFTAGESSEAKLDKVTNYLYMLLEQLRYTLNNLGTGNWNEAELAGLGVTITEPVYLKLESLEGNLLDLSASTDGIRARVENVEGDVAGLTLTAGQLSTRVSDAEKNVSKVDQYARSISLSVSNGSTSSTVKLLAGGVSIASQVISMSGLVTYTGLSGGTTTIDGACIKTGTISADRLDLTGAITFSDLSSSVKNDISNAYSMAEEAQSMAQGVENTVDRWVYPGTTHIDGEMIETGTVRASTLEGGEINLLDGRGRTAGSLTLKGASSYNGRALTIDSGAVAIMANYGAVYMEAGDGGYMQLTAEASFGADIRSSRSGTYSCGTSGYPWSDVYADNSTIQTSDRSRKNSIEALPEKYLTMLSKVEPVRYKLNDGTSGRYHVGFIAQDVEAAMQAAGVDPVEFGGFIKAQDEDGNDLYMLRYSEFLAILWARLQRLEKQVKGEAA